MNTLASIATGRNILILLALFLLVNFVLVPRFYPTFTTLDMLTSYTPEQAYKLMASYGEQGRQAYMISELTLDLIYPPISALLFSLLILVSFRAGFPNLPWLRWLALIPFGVLAADWLENASVVTMLASYPQRLTTLAKVSNLFTNIKFLLTPLELLFVVGAAAGVIRLLAKRMRPRARAI